MMIYNKGATRTVPGAFCFFSKAVLRTITTAYVVGKTPFMSGTRVLAVRVATTAIHEGRFAMPITCVYAITNLLDGKRYIGSTVDFVSRRRRHRLLLKAGKHHSLHLQRAWERDGVDAFVFEVLEECDVTDRAHREQFWIDALQATDDRCGYNIAPYTYSSLGRRHSSETKQTMSEARAGALNANAKLCEEEVRCIKHLLLNGERIMDIAKTFGVSYFVIWDIACGKRWGQVEVSGFVPKKQGFRSGEKNSQAKLTNDMVGVIKQLLREGTSGKDIAERMGISKQTVSGIKRGDQWRTVP